MFNDRGQHDSLTYLSYLFSHHIPAELVAEFKFDRYYTYECTMCHVVSC